MAISLVQHLCMRKCNGLCTHLSTLASRLTLRALNECNLKVAIQNQTFRHPVLVSSSRVIKSGYVTPFIRSLMSVYSYYWGVNRSQVKGRHHHFYGSKECRRSFQTAGYFSGSNFGIVPLNCMVGLGSMFRQCGVFFFAKNDCFLVRL